MNIKNFIRKYEQMKNIFGIEHILNRKKLLKNSIKVNINSTKKLTDIEINKNLNFKTNMTIKYKNYIITVLENYVKTIWTIDVFEIGKELQVDSFIININKLPRIYIYCSKLDNCKHANKIEHSKMIKTCMKTRNVCYNCIKYNGTYTTIADKFISIAEIILKLNTYMNTKEYIKTTKLQDKTVNTTKTQKKYLLKNNVLKYNNKIYISNTQNTRSITSTPKCKHIRRSHKRTLKNGKIIDVKACIINKEKDDKEYNI